MTFKKVPFHNRMLAYLEAFVDGESDPDEDVGTTLRAQALRNELDNYRRLIEDLRGSNLLPENIQFAHCVALWNLAFDCSRTKKSETG